MEKGLKNPLLLSSEEIQQEDEEDDGDGSEESSEDSRKPANSIVAAYKLLTPSVKVDLLHLECSKFSKER